MITKRFSESELRKQPKWIKDHINSLYRSIDELQGHISEITGDSEEPSDIQWTRGISAPRNLPRHSKVDFIVNEEHDQHSNAIQVYKSEHFGKTCIRIQGDRSILVHPASGNAVNISLED